jgi:hypothetical protein
VLWLDEASAELRDIAFQYVNAQLPGGMTGGGQTKFRRLASGAWIVDEWKLSMPRVEQRRRTIEQFGINNSDFVQVGVTEAGGSIVVGPDASSVKKSSVIVSGVIYDSLNNRALKGAGVTLEDVIVLSDKDGRFSFTNVPIGLHSISFTHVSNREAEGAAGRHHH